MPGKDDVSCRTKQTQKPLIFKVGKILFYLWGESKSHFNLLCQGNLTSRQRQMLPGQFMGAMMPMGLSQHVIGRVHVGSHTLDMVVTSGRERRWSESVKPQVSFLVMDRSSPAEIWTLYICSHSDCWVQLVFRRFFLGGRQFCQSSDCPLVFRDNLGNRHSRS